MLLSVHKRYFFTCVRFRIFIDCPLIALSATEEFLYFEKFFLNSVHNLLKTSQRQRIFSNVRMTLHRRWNDVKMLMSFGHRVLGDKYITLRDKKTKDKRSNSETFAKIIGHLLTRFSQVLHRQRG